MRISTIKLFCVLALGLVICLPVASGATVLTFDTIQTTDGWAALPTNYGDLTWSAGNQAGAQWEVVSISQSTYGYQPYYHNTFNFPSNNNAAYNGAQDGRGATNSFILSSAEPINFVGAFFGTWTQNNTQYASGASQITITGYNSGSTVGSKVINLLPGALTWYDIGLNHIDQLTIAATTGPTVGSFPAGRDFLMDNFTYTHAPIPASIMLLGSGLLGLGLVGWRRQRS